PCSLNDYRVFCLVFYIFYIHYLAGFQGISRGFGGDCGRHNLSSLINKRGLLLELEGPLLHTTHPVEKEKG
ncbi:MAG: hypothetical protein ACLSAF_22850, partial [Intestinimonas sp.]